MAALVPHVMVVATPTPPAAPMEFAGPGATIEDESKADAAGAKSRAPMVAVRIETLRDLRRGAGLRGVAPATWSTTTRRPLLAARRE